MKKLVLLLISATLTSRAAELQLSWNPSPSTNVGYKVYHALVGGTNVYDAGTNLTLTLTNVTPSGMRFWVTAVERGTNTWRLESDPSNVVVLPDPVKPIAPALWLMILKP